MKKQVFWIVSSIVIMIIMIIIYFSVVIPLISKYDTKIEERQFSDSHISISIPKKWIVYDVKKIYMSKPGYEGQLIITGRNYGGFPQLQIYRIELLDIEFQETIENSLVLWNKSRIEASSEDIEIIFEEPINFLSGQIISYIKDDPSVDLFPRVECKDWIKIIDRDAYIVSICELENKWEKLEVIYPDIIESFKEID